ncbi:MAG: rhodanese-like domain-containing protein [Candidatus Acetothermia bacterium]
MNMYETIDREELQRQLAGGEAVTLIEVLSEEEYEKGHIKGAINIPLPEIGREAKKRFDSDEKIVVYCADLSCEASPEAAKKLDALGFENVYDYEEGKKGWREAGNPTVSGKSPE